MECHARRELLAVHLPKSSHSAVTDNILALGRAILRSQKQSKLTEPASIILPCSPEREGERDVIIIDRLMASRNQVSTSHDKTRPTSSNEAGRSPSPRPTSLQCASSGAPTREVLLLAHPHLRWSWFVFWSTPGWGRVTPSIPSIPIRQSSQLSTCLNHQLIISAVWTDLSWVYGRLCV